MGIGSAIIGNASGENKDNRLKGEQHKKMKIS